MGRARFALPAPTPPRVESRNDHCASSIGRGVRRILRVADCSDRQSARAVGEMDGIRDTRAVSAVSAELWTGRLDASSRTAAIDVEGDGCVLFSVRNG